VNRSEKPLLFLLGQALPNRVTSFVRLAEAMPIEMVDLANDVPHGAGPATLPDSIPHIDVGLQGIPGLIRSGRYRAVMIETQAPASFVLAALTAHRVGLPLIIWMGLQEVPRNLRWRIGGSILRRALRWSDAVISYGAAQADLATALGAQRVVRSINPVDLGFWSTAVEGQSTSHLQFVFAGRREPEKGPHILIEAWERSGLSKRGATLHMVGGGSWKPGNGYPEGVTAEGPVTRERMREIYAGSDVLVVPSISTKTFKEPWGMVVGEAMCQGVAVIASDSVGAAVSRLAVDEQTALVVPEADPTLLARAMERLESDEALRLALAQAGHKRVQGFGPDRWVRDMEEALDLATANR
jgi:glycosyltransferase involved in cell wall biosynthesis